jgi:glycosyltransferase involved in cell wall biosynthesis
VSAGPATPEQDVVLPAARRSRIAVATADPLTPRMAGPAIRAWQIATALAQDSDVRLVTTSECSLTSPGLQVRQLRGLADARELEAWCDVLFFQGNALQDVPFLRATPKVVVVDLYDPFHLEQLERSRAHGPDARRLSLENAVAEANQQCLRGDFLVCASEKQRDFWLGHLAALGRDAEGHHVDERAQRRVVVVADGVEPAEPPQGSAPVLKSVVDGIGPDDRVVLWGGGIYNWFDPLTLIRAVDRLRGRRDDVRLFFLGMQHPHPDVPEMRMATEARALSAELGLTGTSVFFNEQWVPYDERGRYLLEADVGVSTHLDHVETAFSFRTRMLDYLWAGLPMACTRGDVFAQLVEEHGLGLTVDAGDVDGLADALERLLSDDALAAECRVRVAALAPSFHWSRVLAPLLSFCSAPRRAPDLVDEDARGRLARGVGRVYQPRSGLRRELDIATDHLRSGGVRLLASKAASRVAYATGRKSPPAPQG